MDKELQKQLAQFICAYPLQRYKKHESIIREGDAFDKIYYLKSGFVRLYSLTKSGKEISLHIYTTDDLFPFYITLNETISNYYFEALTPVEVYTIPKDKFEAFSKESATLLYELAKRAGEIMSSALRHMEMLATESSYNNVSSILSYLCTVYKPYSKNPSVCEIPFSHQEIASWINTTRETVTRQIQKLSKKGIVRGTHRHVVIRNLKNLEAEID